MVEATDPPPTTLSALQEIKPVLRLRYPSHPTISLGVEGPSLDSSKNATVVGDVLFSEERNTEVGSQQLPKRATCNRGLQPTCLFERAMGKREHLPWLPRGLLMVESLPRRETPVMWEFLYHSGRPWWFACRFSFAMLSDFVTGSAV